jgi:RnfABCDGE-type electron transport complex D subunit
MSAVLTHAPHAHAAVSVTRVMSSVMLALVPATLFGFWLYGWPAFNLWLISVLACAAAEYACLRIAGKAPAAYLSDGSAVLTGWLLALSLPPWAPWWIAAVGGVFAIVICKQVFGGIGQNLFNPAMVARVALLISFPVEMTTWVSPSPMFSSGAPGFLEGMGITFGGIAQPDAVTSASLLGHIKSEFSRGVELQQALTGHFDPTQAAIGMRPGSMGETSALLVALGGMYLVLRGVISWRIPAAMLLGVTLPGAALHAMDPAHYADASLHLLSGSVILGAFFIATDPVASPSSKLGQLVFGAGCGLLCYIIRTWGGYPEGVAFAVVLMNAFTPVIDRYLRPRVYGRTRSGKAIETQPAERSAR